MFLKSAFVLIAFFVPMSGFAATLLTTGAPLCAPGQHRINGTCYDGDSADATGSCPEGFVKTSVTTDSFMSRFANGGGCLSTHSIYEHPSYLSPLFTGILLSSGAPLCAPGQYRINGTCYDKTDENATGTCPDGYLQSSIASDAFMSRFANGGGCLSTYSTYEYYPQYFSPIFNGILLSTGAPLGQTATMQQNRCSVNSENYYKFADADSTNFTLPSAGVCASGNSKYVVRNDCKDIDISNPEQINKNPVCGVLCDSGVYTNSGVCATGYCEIDGAKKRIYVKRDDTVSSWPLYASKTTDTSINVSILTPSGAPQLCYMNLIPTKVTNTLNVEKDGKTYYGID